MRARERDLNNVNDGQGRPCAPATTPAVAEPQEGDPGQDRYLAHSKRCPPP